VDDDERVTGVVQRGDHVEGRGLFSEDRAADLQYEDVVHVMYSALMRT
jgi:hypothetical protein